jgi:anti-anti-sigma factor
VIALQVEHFNRVPVARVPVDIDASNAATVRDELITCMRHESFQLVVDLTATRYLDSAGIDMLFRLNESLAQRRATLHLVIPPESDLRRLAEIVGLPDAIPVHGDVTEAVEVAGRGAGESAGDR